MKKLALLLLLLPLLFFITELGSRSAGVANILGQDRTGGPVSSGNCGGCHSGGAYTPTVSLAITDNGGNAVTAYTGGVTYNITLTAGASSGTPVGYGCQLVVLKSGNANAGSLTTPGANTRITNLSSRQYMENSARNPTGVFTAKWTAPVSGTGTVNFYYIAVAANGNNNDTGDRTTAPASLALPEACPLITSTQNPTICSGRTLTVGTHTYNSTGTYLDTLSAVNGCDSIVTTHLTVNPPITHSQSPVICQGQSVTVGIHTYTATGTYTDNLTTPGGCDSIVTTNLTVLQNASTNQSFQLCQGQSVNVGIHTYNATGVYHDTLNAANGCDSVIQTSLTVNPVYNQSQNIQICMGRSYVINGHTYTTNGTYHDTLQTVSGCDSIVVTNLSVVAAIQISQNGVLCPSDTLHVGIHAYYLPGTYLDTLVSAGGCDSIVTTNLSSGTPNANTISPAICAGDTFFAGGLPYTNAGTFVDTLQNASGCDSVLTINLAVHALPNVSITVPAPPYCIDMNSVALTGNPPGGTFSGTAMSGNIFNPSAAGLGLHSIYYAFTDSNSCSASDTVSLEVVVCNGFGNLAGKLPVRVGWNDPALILNGLEKGLNIQLSDLNGRVLATRIAETETERFERDSWPSLILIQVSGNGKQFVAKLYTGSARN